MSVLLRDASDGRLHFSDPDSSNYFHDLHLLSSEGKVASTNKLMFSCVSSLSSVLDESEQDYISVQEASFDEVQTVINFLHTGLIPKDLGQDLMKTFDCLGIQLQGKSFGKQNEEISPLLELPKIEPLVKCELSEEDSESDIDDFNTKEPELESDIDDMDHEDDSDTKDKLVDDKFNMSYNMEGVCQFCGGHYKKLRQHMEAKHNTGLPMNFECEKCPKKFPSRRLLEQHERKTHKRVFCDECGKIFACKVNFNHHMATAHGKEQDRPFACPDCPLRFPTKQQLSYHAKRCKDEIRPHKCRRCEATFFNLQSRSFHEQTIHKEKIKTNNGVGLTMMTTESESICEECGKVFKGPACLYLRRTHMLTMHTKDEDKPFQCDICKKGFSQKGALDKHTIAMHTKDEDKPFVCNICGKGFKNRGNYQDHMYIHENKKTFKCSTCEAGFNTKGNRNAHERTVHLGIKPGQVRRSRKRLSKMAELKEEEGPEERKRRWQEALEEKRNNSQEEQFMSSQEEQLIPNYF